MTKTTAIILFSIGLIASRLSAQDTDFDQIPDVIEKAPILNIEEGFVLTEDILRSGQVAGYKGSVSESENLGSNENVFGVSIIDDQGGFGYYRISHWQGDLQSKAGEALSFGVVFSDLGTSTGSSFATTSTRDVALVSGDGTEIHADIQWGVYEIEPTPQRFGNEFQYQVPLTKETFRCSQEKLERVLSDLVYIDIRAEIWAGINGVESTLVSADTYFNGHPDDDGDGTPNFEDEDSDNDGILDLVEGSVDTDQDGAPNFKDLDSDGDTILDALEGSADFDGDGLANRLDTDSDNDGILDVVEGAIDTDEDASYDFLDLDSDNDGLADQLERIGDLDGDGLADYRDTDSDNDAILDGVDADIDGDGLDDVIEVYANGLSQNLISNGDFEEGVESFTSSYVEGDLTDAPDGTVYTIDQDPSDVSVSYPSVLDSSGGEQMMIVRSGRESNELVWEQPVDVKAGMEYVMSALVTSLVDGQEPALDFRVDGTSLETPVVGGDVGVWERHYATFTAAVDATVMVQIYSIKTNRTLSDYALDGISLNAFDYDHDADGIPNFRDLDSDGDTIADSMEGASDLDEDGLPNYLDLDSDQDGVIDEIDGLNDFDGDGLAGYQDTDSDNDSVSDTQEGTGDFDGDGIADFEDNDNDNDGVADPPAEDTDGDGLINSFETLTLDTDNDGTPDYLDLDSDGDGLSDRVESTKDIDRDGVYDYKDHQPVFSPNGYAYESYNGSTQFALVDVNKGVFINVGKPANIHYNAIAYRVADNYIYGQNRSSSQPELMRIGSDGSLALVGVISGIPKTYVAGTFGPNGLYWTSGGGRLYGVDVETLEVVQNHKLSQKTKGGVIDLAYNFVDETMYGSSSKGDFFKVSLENGDTEILGNNGKTFGALICDFNGAVYGFDNKGTGAFRVNLVNGSVTWIASAPKTGINDGTISPQSILRVDSDGDGINDEVDPDDDNDGIIDELEGCGYNPNGDEDGDGIRNWTDTKDDGDGGDSSSTRYEDTTGDGIPDVFDLDSDGVANHLDLDRDGDGLFDLEEADGDADADGLANACDPDADGDGTTDGEDGLGDDDNDGTPNYLDDFDDNDDDEDGIPNGIEGNEDTDGDGIPNSLDPDSDDDGILDSDEVDPDGNLLDSDNDGIPNPYDDDDDNDGIPTIYDPCPLCNLDDNIIEFDVTGRTEEWGVYEAQYNSVRNIWGTLLYELNCNTDGLPLEEEKRGFDQERFFLDEDSEVFVTVIYDGGNHINSLYWYDSSNPFEFFEIWENFATGPTAPLLQGSSSSLGVLPAGTELRFGLVMDGGRGGESPIFQDSFLNPGGHDHVASRLELEDVGNPLIVSFEDELSPNRDNDFNDVIIMVEIVPKSDGTTQFGNIASASVQQALEAGSLANAEKEHIEELYIMPESGTVDVEINRDGSHLQYTLGVFEFDKVSNLNPEGQPFQIVTAENMITVIDDRQHSEGDTVTFDPSAHGLGGKAVGFMIIPANSVQNFLGNPNRYTPRGNGNETKRQPLYSLNSANPDGFDQLLSFGDTTKTLLCFEDHTREFSSGEAGDDSSNLFESIQITITSGLQPKAHHNNEYFQSTPDVTTDWDGVDGWSGDQNGDF